MDIEIVGRIKRREAVVGVVGLGYVGLPLVLALCRRDFKVVGFDIDTEKVDMLRAGKSYIHHISSTLLSPLVDSEAFTPTCDFAQVGRCDALLLCVPTPLNKNREPDMSYVEGTARMIAPHMRRGQLVVLESTTYPGTTDGVLKDILERDSGLVAGDDFLLAYSPEREDPGNPKFETSTIPKVVGGLTPASREAAAALYGQIITKVVQVSSPRVAEMTKLLENIFRSVNIALVNELKVLGEQMGIDVWEVIDAAATKPFGYMPFYPGPGLGGHCIPIDPFYLTWKAREYGLSTRFIELAGEVNTSMPRHVIERTTQALNDHMKALKGAKILVLGLAYKKDVDDCRESPALTIIEMLQHRGAVVTYHDPYVPEALPTRHHNLHLQSVPLSQDTLGAVDAVLIVTDHSNIDYNFVVSHAPLVIDSRNATRKVTEHRERIVRA